MKPTKCIDRLLESLVDYAGLFPPAGLPMAEAVHNYAQYRCGEDRAALGAFVVPVARVEEMLAIAPATADDPWPVSLLWTRGPEIDAEPTAQIVGDEPRLTVEAVETRASNREGLEKIAGALGATPGFVEFPWDEDAAAWLASLGSLGLRAKIRTGGVDAALIPPPEAVASFLEACVDAGRPFKATAGLHHPIRGLHALTYEPQAPTALMHGYLNVFVGGLLYWKGRVDSAELRLLLEEEDPAAFRSTDTTFSWRDRTANIGELWSFRRELACSFGSCSFTEPLDDLRTLEMR